MQANYTKLLEDLKSGKYDEYFIFDDDSVDNSFKSLISIFGKYVHHLFFITPIGNGFSGINGLWFWCLKQKLPFKKTLIEYLEINEPYNKLRNKGLVDATAKAKSVFGNDLQMEKMYFCEFYKIPRFGKTRVGQLLLHAKQTQNEKYIRLICEEFAPKIREFAQEFDSICFAPPTTPRALQFMDVLKEILAIDLPIIETSKIFGDIAIQQKTLKLRQDRVENANATIVVESDKQYQNCLIIDDAIGSGSTLNQIALKMRVQKIISGKIVGLGIVGNLDGFEVINEV